MDLEKIMFKEIRLVSLFVKAEQAKRFSWNIKNKYWCKVLKPEMSKLVGFESKNKELNTCEIYDMVYFHCMNLMDL